MLQWIEINLDCKQLVQLGQFEMNCGNEYRCRTAHIHRCSYTCLHVTWKLIGGQIRWISIRAATKTITTTVSIFANDKIVITFEVTLEIIISMTVKRGESGQGLGVVVFVILQQTTTVELHH